MTPMSLGRSISTGPGRPERAISNASAKMRGMSAVSRMTKLCFTIGRVIAEDVDFLEGVGAHQVASRPGR